MAETRTKPLAAWMTAHQMSASELADAVNGAIGALTGRPGTTAERTVFRWLSGENRWPQARQRRALESVTGLPVTALGFVPRGKSTHAALPEDPDMRRRRLFGAAVGTAAAAISLTPPAAPRPSRVGTSDVIRLRNDVERLLALDAERGGHGLERSSLAGAGEALRLQTESATQRVRQRLYALAADFTATAAWSLIDSGRLDGAGHHLDRALALAGLAQNSEIALQVWNLRAMLARQRRDYPEAVASSQAAQATAITRRSPLHASLAHARTAVGLAHGGEARAALRCLSRAEDALAKADPAQPRSSWIAFYGPAELHSLTAIVRDTVGHAAEAEAASHRALAALPDSYRRNRAYTTARLALAQLHQGDVEQACATSGKIFEIMAGTPLPGRMRLLLGDFQRDLLAQAPAALAHEWTDRHRTEWSSS
ncbi:XRE family transcriptional regulator [Streptomyces sp. SR27]|uniref:XRE family transcriptional regulator n=1 Tax=Streptomyces sp. SR27 TaxID=3076630 RepID=UPI00295A9AE6|nr:XRE family transcriptional regulator [Streptomyces sp. SR27]MDV9187660.1 XRE family transcriptional regulator [Streptomyces sp. SR27]